MVNKLILPLLILLFNSLYSESKVRFPDDAERPYNYRVIDEFLHVGGTPLSPSYSNSDEKVMSILKYLKSKGVLYVVTLDGSRKSRTRLPGLIRKAGLTPIKMYMNASKVPNDKEWKKLLDLMRQKKGIYIHCTWGADRSGAIVAKYLVDLKGYTPEKAWRAITTGGSHAGKRGGFKKSPSCKKLLLFFWSNVKDDEPDVARIYEIGY